MGFKINDPVFTSLGEPGIVKKIDQDTQKFSIEKDQKVVQESFRHGYLRGMNPDLRNDFNTFMDEVNDLKEPSEKVALIQEKIASLEKNFSPKNYVLLTYLNSELSHIKSTFHYEPRLYSAKEDNIF